MKIREIFHTKNIIGDGGGRYYERPLSLLRATVVVITSDRCRGRAREVVMDGLATRCPTVKRVKF
jgi:hypothetical protein